MRPDFVGAQHRCALTGQGVYNEPRLCGENYEELLSSTRRTIGTGYFVMIPSNARMFEQQSSFR